MALGDPMALIDVTNVVKEYRTAKRQPGVLGAVRTLFTRQHNVRQAVAGISFSVEVGELIGYIGPNGAGKSLWRTAGGVLWMALALWVFNREMRHYASS
ncbi:MAG: hypothetical protein HC853_04910 [Anaerolineae bacterium]|nr:hypothetical protein [Anaerolineae bacterium]